MAKSFRIYRPNKNGNGFASEWQLSFKENNKYDKYQLFLTVAKQTGTDDNNNASFDWKESSITVKLGDNDVGDLLAVLSGYQDSVGYKGSIYHETPGGGNKSLTFNHNKEKGGFYLKVTSQDKDKNVLGPYAHSLSDGEGLILKTLLEKAITQIYGW